MNRLFDVLVRFRYHKYVMTCDVSNMFLRVKVPEADRRYLRFFYRDSDSQLKIVEMSSHAFGLTQSPFVVMEAIRSKARERSTVLPSGTSAVLNDSIVDDILTGSKNFASLEKTKNEICQFYGEINMKVHKWATNSPTLRNSLLDTEKAGAVSLGQDLEGLYCAGGTDVPSIKCLGVLWHPESDRLQFFHEKENKQEKWTMRKISSRTSRLFDPLGLMCPLLLEGKLIMQSLWRLKLTWDEPIPLEVADQYNRWLRRASTAHLSHIERRVKAPFRSLEERLVVFTDASSQAQGAVAYLYCQGEHQCAGRLWAAKQKISSLNRSDSISRLELEGAVLGVELAKSICRAMKWDMSSVLFFTDSTTVLWWLRTHKELDVFVGNRVCKILDGSGLQQWFHVATGSNPADIPTRGLSGKLLAKSALWWEGPEFFTSPRKEWPKQPEVVETRICSEGYRKEEKRRTEAWCQLQTVVPSGVDPRSGFPDAFWLDVVSRQSNVKLAMGVACRVFEFLGKFKRHNWSIHRARLLLALQIWVFRAAQAEGLPELLQSVESGNKPPKEFAALDPMLDQHHVLRLGGRLRYASRLPQSVRCPVILSGNINTHINYCILCMHTSYNIAGADAHSWLRVAGRSGSRGCQDCPKRSPKLYSLRQISKTATDQNGSGSFALHTPAS